MMYVSSIVTSVHESSLTMQSELPQPMLGGRQRSIIDTIKSELPRAFADHVVTNSQEPFLITYTSVNKSEGTGQNLDPCMYGGKVFFSYVISPKIHIIAAGDVFESINFNQMKQFITKPTKVTIYRADLDHAGY